MGLHQILLNRRSFMKKAGATGTTFAIGMGTTTTANATPKKGGTLRVGLSGGSTTDTFDPRTFADTMHSMMGRAVCNQLVQASNDGKVTPELATSWEQNKNGTVWTIKLRQGVKFHNGKEFTADDAVYSLSLHADKDSKSGAYGYLNTWKEIKKTGKYEVTVSLESANQDFPWILNDYHLIMLPADFKDWSNPIGTGGYKLTSFKPGSKVEFKRNPDYWKPNSAYFDKVQILSIKDAVSRQNALLSKQVDVIDNVLAKTAKLLERRNDIDLVLSTTGRYNCQPMNTTKSPFSDNNVRQAIKHGVDRKQIIDNILLGYGSIGNDQPISSGDEFYNPNITQTTYDPEKSKYFLKKAGMSSLKINLSSSDSAFSGANDTAVLMREALKVSGIDLNVVREPSDGYWSDVWMKKPFVSSYWGRSPTAALTFTRTYHSTASWNDTAMNSPRLDALLHEMQINPDQSVRKEAAFEIQEIIHNDGGMLVTNMPQSIDAKSNKLRGHNPHPIYDMDDVRICEKGWFA